jgi:hypothetical protein
MNMDLWEFPGRIPRFGAITADPNDPWIYSESADYSVVGDSSRRASGIIANHIDNILTHPIIVC